MNKSENKAAYKPN